MTGVVDLAVIGAGPAGMEAALAAAQAGVKVCLIDSSPRPGGQYFKQIPYAFQASSPEVHLAKVTGAGSSLFQRLKSSRIPVYSDTLVWGLFEGPSAGVWSLKLYGAGAPATLLAQRVIVASGAYDQSIPFPGWDLPGVITAGAALTLVKHQGVLPGRRVLLTGTGPLQLAAAAYLVQAGAEVVGVCESAVNLPRRILPYLPAAWGQWARMGEGLGYLLTLARAGVPYRIGWAVTSASGRDRVQQATLARLDHTSRPLPSSQVNLEIDSLVVGFSLLPCTELLRSLDCDLEYDPLRGGYLPRRDASLQTSLPGIYAAGDCAGIGGAAMACIEGRIAGLAVAASLGHLSSQAAAHLIEQEMPALNRERRFARLLGGVFSPAPGLHALARDDTILCRCEQVTLAQVKEAVDQGAQTVSDVKNLARAGMGNCQGRTCGNLVAQALARETGQAVEETGCFQARPPVHPLPLQVLEELDEPASLQSSGEARL